MHRSTVLTAVAALVVCSLTGVAAGAQERSPTAPPDPPAGVSDSEPEPAATPPRSRADIEEIVVQGGESDAAADMGAGDSVTGFNASDLEALGAQSIEDLAGFTPNLEIVTAGATTPTFFIRGVGLNDFNPNSSGSVAIFTDDVPRNAPALQLGTLFDIEGVNILRGPQGTGASRNASAGAIKVYSKKPSGEFGGYLRSEIGNFNARDFEGAVEMPLFEDILSTRLAFRFTKRDGYGDNRCGNVTPHADRAVNTGGDNSELVTEAAGVPGVVGFSLCGETVSRPANTSPFSLLKATDGKSEIADGLPTKVNDRGNWASRAMLRFQPTLDQDWLLTASLAQRDELARLGQSIPTGIQSSWCGDAAHPETTAPLCKTGTYGTRDGRGYQPIELVRLKNFLDPCALNNGLKGQGGLGTSNGNCTFDERRRSANAARIQLARGLKLDSLPYEGDYDRVGDLTNDVWGTSLKGEIAFSDSLTFTTITGYDTYDRFNDLDLDFSPNELFEVRTKDDGWQATQDLRLSGVLSDELPIGWEVGGLYLMEEIGAFVDIFLPTNVQPFATTSRDWDQRLWSLSGYGSFDWDFWDDFTLDGGVRYNWERKTFDMVVYQGTRPEEYKDGMDRRRQAPFDRDSTWQAPTGTLRLTYRFREDTHAYWKYSRGWKGGHYNATVSPERGVTTAEPESIDAFEMGLSGAFFNGRLNFDASLFHYDYDNYQLFTVLIPLGGFPEFVVLNANNAEVYGGELDLVVRPLPGLFLQGRFSWLESRFVDFVLSQAQSRQVGIGRVDFVRELDYSGNALLNSPQFKVALTAEQTLPLGRFGSITGRWDGAWTDDTYYDPSEGRGTPTFEGIQFLPKNSIGQKAYWLHNVNVSYRTPDGSVEVGAWVRNATNEVYKSFSFDASALDANQTTIHFLGEPRTFGMSLTVTF